MNAMTPEIVKPGEVIRVCAHCYPNTTVFTDYPWFAGLKISHGVCEYHAAQMREEMKKALATQGKSQFAI